MNESYPQSRIDSSVALHEQEDLQCLNELEENVQGICAEKKDLNGDDYPAHTYYH